MVASWVMVPIVLPSRLASLVSSFLVLSCTLTVWYVIEVLSFENKFGKFPDQVVRVIYEYG